MSWESHRVQRIDRLGALLSVVGALALASLPLIVFKANRIVPGEPRALLDVIPTAAFALYFVLAVGRRGRHVRPAIRTFG